MSWNDSWSFLKQTFSEWSEDKVPRLGAALAYYTVFSIAPLLLIAIAIAGLVFDPSTVRDQLNAQLGDFIGPSGASAIQALLESASKPSSGIIATIIGAVTLLFGASGVFGQLKDALNTIWDVEKKPGGGIWGFIKDRFLSFTMVLGIGFLLLVSLVVSTVIQALQSYLFTGSWSFLVTLVNIVVSLAIITLLFALIFKVLPDVEIAWHDVWIGAFVTAALFTVGKYAISLYVGRAAPESSLSGVGALIVVLLWVYYSAQIMFFGAELTQVYANRYGSKVVPDDDAVALTDERRAELGIPRQEQVERQAHAQSGARRSAKPKRQVPRHVLNAAQQAPQKLTLRRFKQLKRQRYTAALVGFLAALFLGGWRGSNQS